eukprot:6438722-Amphidinium_carterae.1
MSPALMQGGCVRRLAWMVRFSVQDKISKSSNVGPIVGRRSAQTSRLFSQDLKTPAILWWLTVVSSLFVLAPSYERPQGRMLRP